MKKKITYIVMMLVIAGGIAVYFGAGREKIQQLKEDNAAEQNISEVMNNTGRQETGNTVLQEQEMDQTVMIEALAMKKAKTGEYNIKAGKTKVLHVSITPKDADMTELKWESSDEAIAEVSEEGIVTGKQEGVVKITASATDGSGKRAVVKVKVVPEHTYIYKQGFYYHNITDKFREKMEGKFYKENDNIQYSDLRYIAVKHYDYKGKVQTGELVVNQKIAQDIVEIFYELYEKKYPIQSMRLIDEYDADDTRSMESNNTSAFNYRTVPNKTSLSNHSYGLAIDINPRINPYVTNGGQNISPENGAEYAERDVEKCTGKYKENMIHKGDVIYNIFIKHGFTWGGEWNNSKDYQHFEKK